MLKLSIVICTKDRPVQLRRCLETIIAQTLPPKEIIIVDASSNEASRKVVDGFMKVRSKVKYYYVHTRPGLTRQRNLGIEMTQGDIVGFLDDDAELEPDVFSIIMDVMNNPKIKEVGGVMLSTLTPGDALIKKISFKIFFKKLFLLSHHSAKKAKILSSGYAVFPFRRRDVLEPMEAEILNGMCFYHKEVFKKFKFEERLTGYSFMEDVEFSSRVSREHKLLYVPQARAMHFHVDVGRSDNYLLYKQTVENHHYFFTNNVKQTFLNRLAFLWANLGMCITTLAKRPRWGRKGAVTGFFAGFRTVLNRQRASLYDSAAKSG